MLRVQTWNHTFAETPKYPLPPVLLLCRESYSELLKVITGVCLSIVPIELKNLMRVNHSNDCSGVFMCMLH